MVSEGRRGWAPSGEQYVKRSRARRTDTSTLPESPLDSGEQQIFDTGIVWSAFDTTFIKPSRLDRARHRFRAALPELIWNAAALEGNTFTLPEVRTLLDGVTVGGHKAEEENQILALSEAYNELDRLVGAGDFRLSKEISDVLNGLVARHEAIESGHFRGEGKATGGGAVHLASGGIVAGVPHGLGGELLRERFERVVSHLQALEDPRQRALLYFAAATRSQFYFDGNKRTARLMMSGELMAGGFDAVNVPYARKLEFNRALDTLFATDDATELVRFLSDCAD